MILHSKAASSYVNEVYRKDCMEDVYISQVRRIALFKAKAYMKSKQDEEKDIKKDG